MSEPRDEQLHALEQQVSLLTQRVYQLEQLLKARPIHQQPVAEFPSSSPPNADPPPSPDPPPAPAEPAPAADWEDRFGTSWLNRAGVLLIVIGVVLFLGYAMTGLGPAGRVLIATLAGLALLATGYYFEAKGNWRPWSLVTLGGGFAVLYATAYAAHAVDAARVITVPHLGVLLQTAIALAAVWQATRLDHERATAVAFFAAFAGILSSDGAALRFLGSVPLSAAGIWLAARKDWNTLAGGIALYSWLVGFATGSEIGESPVYGQPVAWYYLSIFASFEIWSRTRAPRLWHPLFLVLNAGAFFFSNSVATNLPSDDHSFRILAWLSAAGLVTSAVRYFLQVRREALSEALVLAGGLLSLGKFVGDRDPLLFFLLALALAFAALAWNHRAPTLALTLSAELGLALVALALMVTFPETKILAERPLIIHQALPHLFLLMILLFAAGRFYTATPWPSWLALAVLAEATLWTVPKTLGTILLSLEAILAVAAGLALQRRPIRLGGLALFAFSVLKVFFYDLAELSTLPRIFSFLVLGALLLGASWGYTRYRRELQKYL